MKRHALNGPWMRLVAPHPKASDAEGRMQEAG